MTKADKQIIKDLQVYFDKKHLQLAQDLYLTNYGGSGGCEECQENWAICFECLHYLNKDVKQVIENL